MILFTHFLWFKFPVIISSAKPSKSQKLHDSLCCYYYFNITFFLLKKKHCTSVMFHLVLPLGQDILTKTLNAEMWSWSWHWHADWYRGLQRHCNCSWCWYCGLPPKRYGWLCQKIFSEGRKHLSLTFLPHSDNNVIKLLPWVFHRDFEWDIFINVYRFMGLVYFSHMITSHIFKVGHNATGSQPGEQMVWVAELMACLKA